MLIMHMGIFTQLWSIIEGFTLKNILDDAPAEQKKMIICSLCDRIEVSRDYEVKIVIDMDYEQFCR